MCTYTLQRILGKKNMNNLVCQKIIENLFNLNFLITIYFIFTFYQMSKNHKVIDEAIDGVYTPTDMDRTGRVKTLAGTFLY